MEKYGVNELRKMFLEFFESKGHLAMKSFSLIPHNDKSLLLINSGTDTFLACCYSSSRRNLCACEVRFQRSHTGVDQ